MPVIPIADELLEDSFAQRLEDLDVADYVQGANTSGDVELRRSRRPFVLVAGDQQAHLEFVVDVLETVNTDQQRDAELAYVRSTVELTFAYKVRSDTALDDKRKAQQLARRIAAAVNEPDERFDVHLLTPYRARWAPGGEYLLVVVVFEVGHDYDLTVA